MQKVLNLVYDNFDEYTEEPIPNITFRYPKRRVCDSRNLIKHFIDDTSYTDKFRQRTCSMTEVYDNPTQNYYYIINHGGEMIGDFFENGITPFNDNVVECLLKCLNFFVMFLTEHEPDCEESFLKILNFVREMGINEKQIYIVNNNYKLPEYKEKYQSQINVHTIRFVPHSSTKVLEKIGGCDFEPFKEGKFFQMFNKSPKIHRYGLLCLLKKYNLLDEINWSLVPGYDCQPIDSYYYPLFSKTDREMLKEEIEYFYNLHFKKSDYEVQKDWFNEFSEINNKDFPIWMHVPEYPRNYENTYVNIITESMFLDVNNNIHISEKTFKPFYYYQIPLILSTHNHIKMVKSRYGFDFYDDIINHSYDNEPDQIKRLDMFVNEIKRLSDNKEMIKDFYKNNKGRFIDNKQRVINVLKVVDEDYLFFESLI
jgi:hypothetical protein